MVLTAEGAHRTSASGDGSEGRIDGAFGGRDRNRSLGAVLNMTMKLAEALKVIQSALPDAPRLKVALLCGFYIWKRSQGRSCNELVLSSQLNQIGVH